MDQMPISLCSSCGSIRSLGYSQMFAGEGMTEIKSGSIDEIQNWAYLMFVFTPKYFAN